MAGTTPVTILREPLFHICKDNDEDLAPSGRTYQTDDFHFIKVYSWIGDGSFVK